MKTKILVLVVAGMAAAAFLIPRPAEAQPTSPGARPLSPVGSDCVVTVESQAWMLGGGLSAGQQSGFHPDYTLRGKVIDLGAEWLVLKDGNFENWIARDKVLSIRVTR